MYRGDADDSTDESTVELIKTRIGQSIEISQAVKDGKVSKERQKQTVAFWGYPPLLPIRMDMQTLSTTMIYGPSVDISFACLSDADRSVRIIFNLHIEESVPDYDGLWFLLPSTEPEIFNRRHMKLGIRLGDMGKKIKDNLECARRIREILIDIRNERAPHWSKSAYYIAVYFMIGALNNTLEFSSFNSMGITWDQVNAQDRYGLENCIYNYQPLPPILQMMFNLERPMWIERLTRATLNGQLYLNHIEKSTMEELKRRNYTFYDLQTRFNSYVLQNGIVLPSQSIQAQPPVYNKETKQWDRYGFKFPEGPRIHYEDLGLTVDEIMSGVLFDITPQSKIEKVTRDNVISIGHGLETTYLRPETEE